MRIITPKQEGKAMVYLNNLNDALMSNDAVKRMDAMEHTAQLAYIIGGLDLMNMVKDKSFGEDGKALEQVTFKDLKKPNNNLEGWIPCSERLPEIKEDHTSDVCLCYCSNGAYCFGEIEENIFGQVGWNCERDDDYHEAVGEVIAWMPLPEPYSIESDGIEEEE